MIIKNCLNCNKEIKIYPSQLNYGQGKFCSLSCKGKHEGGGRVGEYTKERYDKIQRKLKANLKAKYPLLFDKEYLERLYYGEQFSLQEISEEIGCSKQAVVNKFKEFEIPMRSLKDSKNTEKYLDKYRGEKNWCYRGGANYDRGSDWGVQRRKARKRDNNTCQCCGKTKEDSRKNLDVHHIIPYRLSKSNKLENLITLCPSCHTSADWAWRKIEEEQHEQIADFLSNGSINTEGGKIRYTLE